MGKHTPATIIAAGGVVYRFSTNDTFEVLLIKKRGGFWSLPKGRVEPGETLEIAAIREVSEETGITGTPEVCLRQVRYTIKRKGTRRAKEVTYYLLRATDGHPRPDPNEAIKYVVWVPLPTALQRLQRKRLRRVVRQAQRVLEHPQ